MAVKREIVLPLSGDLKRVLVQSLARYKEELAKQREALPAAVGLKRLILQGEEQSIEEAMELIQQEWKSALPTVAIPEKEGDRKKAIMYELCRIKRGKTDKVILGFTKEREVVTVIYDPTGFFDLKVGNQRVMASPEVQLIGEEFSKLVNEDEHGIQENQHTE